MSGDAAYNQRNGDKGLWQRIFGRIFHALATIFCECGWKERIVVIWNKFGIRKKQKKIGGHMVTSRLTMEIEIRRYG